MDILPNRPVKIKGTSSKWTYNQMDVLKLQEK